MRTGFAFGMGPQRMLILKHPIDDIRRFWQNDLRFLQQFCVYRNFPMPVVYHCPHCRQPVTVPDPMLGQVLGCPHCRGAFQTFPAQLPVAAPPPPPPPPTPAEVFSLDDADPNEDDEDDRPRRKRYQPGSRYKGDQQKVPLSTQIAMICAVIGSVVMVVVNQNTRKPGQGFDVKEVLYSAIVGGVCAGLGFLIGKLIEGGNANPRPRRKRYGRNDDDDDDDDD